MPSAAKHRSAKSTIFSLPLWERAIPSPSRV